MRSVIRFVSALVALSFAAGLAHAQKYPARPVRILVGTPAGGPGDVVSRGAAQVLTRAFGEPFVVENRVGADGMIAGDAVAKAAPDGHTLLTADNYAISVNPVIRSKMAYDPRRDLVPIIHFGYLAAAILVHPSVPANSLKELFELAKAKPDSIAWASWGLNSSAHFYIEWLKNGKNIRFYNVPYKAASQAFPALLSGEVKVAIFAVGPASQQVKAGKARALAVTIGRRVPQMPDVPTYKEAGLDADIFTWFGLFAPAGTPQELVHRINAELAKGFVNDPAMREKFLLPQGIMIDPPAGASPEEFAAMLPVERERFANIAKIAGIRIE
ncbi:MAG: hypothetical protein A3I00_02815 [Betaproteobacteria bacterium RIFCSPLOWO2_02_FULL_64_12]|nr:MAG: hypothetical protein A3I00_02815 [Betaproteobacteria bacterium RIFCSPLOWO2_02_FULL_64_12]